jgi:arsenate reductase-like glutaredoxin family protein
MREFTVNGIIYMETEKGYCYKVEDGKKTRIKKQELEEAFEMLCEDTDELMDEQVDEWMAEINEAKEAQKQEQADSDKQAEDAINGKKKAKKRKSKDIALEIAGVTFTAKQVDLMRHFPDTCFWEHGLDSTPWIDCLIDEIGGQFADKPMTVGALLSTLNEKGVIAIAMDKLNGKKVKFFALTEFGKQVAKEIGGLE